MQHLSVSYIMESTAIHFDQPSKYLILSASNVISHSCRQSFDQVSTKLPKFIYNTCMKKHHSFTDPSDKLSKDDDENKPPVPDFTSTENEEPASVDNSTVTESKADELSKDGSGNNEPLRVGDSAKAGPEGEDPTGAVDVANHVFMIPVKELANQEEDVARWEKSEVGEIKKVSVCYMHCLHMTRKFESPQQIFMPQIE